MAKGLNLIDTNIIGMHMNVDLVAGDAGLEFIVQILDEDGNVIRIDSIRESFSGLTAQEKANLNNFLRLKSQQINNDKVSENKPSWTDI